MRPTEVLNGHRTIVRQLRSERQRAANEVERLDAAIAALGGSTYGRRNGGSRMSAAARARIAAAQRARWAKIRDGKTQSEPPAPKRTMSAAARAKIAKAQRLRWARQKKAA